MEPVPQSSPRLEEADGEQLTEIAVVNPTVVLMGVAPSLRVLLSRDTLIEPKGIHLRGVRLIEIPMGWRLVALRLAARFWKARLPDEFEYEALRIDATSGAAGVWAERYRVGNVEDANRIVHLTGGEFFALCDLSGRGLHRWIVGRFGFGGRAISRSQRRRRSAA
jgi:hypothetical protein